MWWQSMVLWWVSLSTANAPVIQPKVELGVDRLLGPEIALIAGKRVGLITNASGVDGNLEPTFRRMARDKRFKLVQLYAPEHGIHGAAPAGHRVRDTIDPVTKLPIQSLFGKHKGPDLRSMKSLDVLVFDIQDIGSRTYTYTSTMGESMRSAKAAGIPFIVLDRPNPNGGLRFEGPLMRSRRQGFLGWGPTPVTHGMTAGELAQFYNVVKKVGCKLHVVKMKGWRRGMQWEDTGLRWVPTSPAIPHVVQSHLYAATGMIGGVTKTVNEGYGTTLPFELIGAKFIEPYAFSAALNKLQLPGVRFRPVRYRPSYGRYRKKHLGGVQLILTDPAAFWPIRTAIHIFTTLEKMYPGQTRFRPSWYFDVIWGDKRVMRMIQRGASAKEIIATWTAGERKFAIARKPYLIYPE